MSDRPHPDFQPPYSGQQPQQPQQPPIPPAGQPSGAPSFGHPQNFPAGQPTPPTNYQPTGPTGQPTPPAGYPQHFAAGQQRPFAQPSPGARQFQGGQQAPFAPQAYGVAGRPGQQAQHGGYQPPPGGPRQATGSRKTNVGLIIGIVAGVLALAVVAALLLIRGGVAPGGTASPESATQTVQEYLTALSEGRAADALVQLNPDYIQDDSLLTDEVLADSLTRAPLTDIMIGEAVDEGYGNFTVPVTYTLGDTPVVDELRVREDSGTYHVAMALATISLDDGLDLIVNGAAPASDSPDVFPGSYSLEAAHEYLTFDGGPLMVTKSNDYKGSYDLDLVVTEEGVAMFREKVIAEAQACLASTALDPGCGPDSVLGDTLNDGTPLRDGSIERTQDAEARAQLESITPEPSYSAPHVISVSGYELGGFGVIADCQTEGGGWAPCELWGFGSGLGFGDPSINLNNADLVVEWD